MKFRSLSEVSAVFGGASSPDPQSVLYLREVSTLFGGASSPGSQSVLLAVVTWQVTVPDATKPNTAHGKHVASN